MGPNESLLLSLRNVDETLANSAPTVLEAWRYVPLSNHPSHPDIPVVRARRYLEQGTHVWTIASALTRR